MEPDPAKSVQERFLRRQQPSVEVAPHIVAEVTRLYEAGLIVQAYELARTAAPLDAWGGTTGRLIAGRLAGNLGAPRLGRYLHILAYCGARSNAEAVYYYAATVLQFRGPYATWRLFEKWDASGLLNNLDSPRGLSDLLALRARIAAQFRDFDRSASWLAEAMEQGGAHPWLWCEKAFCLQYRDAHDEALIAGREALRLRPWFRPAVQVVADLLQTAGCDQQALELLREALGHIESGAIAGQLAGVEFELGMYGDAAASFERMRALNPLFDPTTVQWWHGRMCDTLYHCGEFAKAAEHAREAGPKFYPEFAERITVPGAVKRRVHLPVGFVRQHHMTCAPATLSALSGFWQMPVDHAALANAICYDGTAGHIERHWAEQNGYVAREFRVTWEAAVSLLDRGVPFTLVTTETTSAHLQAAIGYDALRRTLLIRNPIDRIHQECQIDPLLERYSAFGPRGMALVPVAESARLDGLDLPEEAFYDLYYREQRALFLHDRPEAEAAIAEMDRLDPEHRLTLFARSELALYDGSLARQEACAEALLAKYPDCNHLRWAKLIALRALSRRAEYSAFLREAACGKNSEPVFWRELAGELAQDARKRTTARQFATLALRYSPCEADNLAILANLLWDEHEIARSADLYRFAACLNDTVDGHALAWFVAARHLRKTEEALAWLKRRFEQFGTRSARPGIALFRALSMLDRTSEAFEFLESALRLRPEDGALLLFSADAFARFGNRERAEALLASAEKRASRMAWLRTSAALADYRCDKARSFEYWREIVGAEPLTIDAQSARIRLIAELEGRPAALAELRVLCERFPRNVPLHRLHVEWMRDEPSVEAEAVIRNALALEPQDAWLRRELALVLDVQRRFDEALREADESARIEPANPSSAGIKAQILLSAGRRVEAREAARDALRHSIDISHPLVVLMNAAATTADKREALAFVRDELIRQVVFGDGLLAYRTYAYPILEPAELLANLTQAQTARPDLWHAWTAVTQQLLDMGRVDESLAVATQATERFPLLPRVWYDLALVHRAKREIPSEISSFEHALQLNSSWGLAAQGLASAHRRAGEFAAARRVLEGAVAADPLEPVNHGCLAEVLWLMGERDAAIATAEHAVRIDPGYDWGWEVLPGWSREMGIPNRAEACARELIDSRPGEARSWYRLAQSLPAASRDERIAALERASSLNPRFFGAIETRAVLLAEAGRFDEATAACTSAPAGETPPVALQGRAAWIHAFRGDRVTAIAAMRTVVAAFPDYLWGWTQLAEWLTAKGNLDEALEVTQSMIRLAPRSAVPLGYRADIQARLGQRRTAFETLQQAFDIDPTYDFAAYTIFDSQLQSRDFAAAEKTLKRIEMHLPGPRARAARVRLFCHKGKKKSALDEFRTICFLPVGDEAAIELAATALSKADWSRDAESLLEELLDEDGVNAEAGAQWVKLFCARGKWGRRSRLYQLDLATKLGQRTVSTYLAETGARMKPGYLKKAVARFGEELGMSAETWGQLCYAYCNNGLYKEAAKWACNWRQHPDAAPWMLHNVAQALRVTGAASEAVEVSRAALRMRGDQTTPEHSVWIACAEAIDGQTDSARDRLATVTHSELKAQPRVVHALATALIAVQTSEPGTRREVYNRHKLLLRQSPRNILASSSVRPTAKRAVEAMAKAAGVQPFRLPGGNIAQGTGRDNTTRWYVIVAVVVISLIRGCVSMGPQSSTPSLPGGDPNAERNFSTPVDPTSQATPAFHFPGEISGTDIVKKGDD